MKENAIPKNTKHALKFGMTLIVLNVTKKPHLNSRKVFGLCRHAWINQWFNNKSCLLWWPVSLSIRIQTTLNHIRLFYSTILKITKEIFVKVVLWSKNYFLFFFRFWKSIRLISNWQNFELCVLSEGCLFWV